MSDSQTEPKTYSSPKLNKVTPEQAKLLLLGHATQRRSGSERPAGRVVPRPNEHEKVSPRSDGERPGGFVTKNPLFIRALMPIGLF